MSETTGGTSLSWVETDGGYQIALEGRELAFRNPRGKRLQAVPREIRNGPLAEQLTRLRGWLDGHGNRCRRAVEEWMLQAVTLPRATLETVWTDPDWQTALRGTLVLVTAPRDPDFLPGSRHGLLVDLDSQRGVELVDADEATVAFDIDTARILHPLSISALPSWRKLAGRLQIEQAIPQLRRSLHSPPRRRSAKATELLDFADGVFARQGALDERCRLMGYESSGGDAICTVREDDRLFEARYWIGDGAPDARARTGRLTWVDRRGRALPLAEVGPVAWSEGVRMAESIYSGRRSR